MTTRREFLRSSAQAALLGCATPASFDLLASRAAAEGRVTPELVRFTPDVEPIVRLIEETPREKCFDMMVEQLKRGLPYRNFLGALFLAGIRNVNPQPPGFKFHCVFAIHSANQLSLDAAPHDRLLPLFWALDQFKKSQEEDVREGDFRLTAVTGRIPSPEKAAAEFHEAMQGWDQERAGRAVIAFVRSRGADEIVEAFWRYGARDFRNIGHKAIFVANSWRTLEVIGWQHAEPTMRSLVLGLLDFGKSRRVNEYAFDDQEYHSNVERARKIFPKLPGTWTGSDENEAASRDLIAAIRNGNVGDACQKAADGLQAGKFQAQAVWDAVHVAAGELMMRQPGILGIHTVTSANALHYMYRTASDPQTRLIVLLQGVGWMGQFRNAMSKRAPGLGSIKITELTPDSIADTEGHAAAGVLELVGKDMPHAAARAFAVGQKYPVPVEYPRLARKLIFRKGTDAHHYKYAAAIFEDLALVSPRWRPHLLATSVYYLRGANDPDSPVMTRATEAVRHV